MPPGPITPRTSFSLAPAAWSEGVMDTAPARTAVRWMNWRRLVSFIKGHGSSKSSRASAWTGSAKQLKRGLLLGIAALHAFNRSVVGFRKRLAIILGLLCIERSALK